MGKPIAILGCSSDAGKSFLVTGLCRLLANRGVKVAPFKAQNMSNNAAVTSEGLEIGRAQYLQAQAARIQPQARMNPVLLKPSAETYSQVIVMGRYDPEISAIGWMERKQLLWPVVRSALDSLLQDFEQVVIEGAGSPAEVNLRSTDIVNMQVALACEADVYLVADIDRGGAFAHLLGTWACLEPQEQALIKGFVLNKFRGDPRLLGNATVWLQSRTGIPTVALIPHLTHILPEEDRLRTFSVASPKEQSIPIALMAYPYTSNFDEFDPLIHESDVSVFPVSTFQSLDKFKAIILPGSKNTSASLRYLRESGLAAEISRAAQRGVPILGICGGMQLLGEEIQDPTNLESGTIKGLGLLDIITTLMPEKVTSQRKITMIDGNQVCGYEIHHGKTWAGDKAQSYLEDDLGWQQENVWGVYLHGLLENRHFRQQFLARLGWTGQSQDWQLKLDLAIDKVAEAIANSGWQV